LPTEELGKNSERPVMEFRASCEGSLRPYRFVTALVPNFFGTPDQTYWGIAPNDVRPGVHTYWETAIYCGVLPLLLAVLGAVFVRSPIVWFLSGMGGISLLLAMGDSFFLYWIVYKLLPLFDRFRMPGRFAYLFTFSVAILAGFGAQWLLSQEHKARPEARETLTRTCLGIGVAALLFGLFITLGGLRTPIADFIAASGRLGQNMAAIEQFVAERIYPDVIRCSWVFVLFCTLSIGIVLLRLRGILASSSTAFLFVAVAFLDLLAFQYGSRFPFSTTSYAARGHDPARVYARAGIVRELQAQLRNDYFRINSRDSRPGTTDLGGRHMIFQKNQGSVHRLFLMEGYNPLRLKRQLTERNAKGLDLLNVRYVIHVDEAAGRMGFVLNPSCLPRVRMVYDYETVNQEHRIQPTMWSDNFDHVKTIILEEQPGVERSHPAESVNWTADITSYSLNAIETEVVTERNGFLVLSEIHYPYWKATVDGEPASLHRANYALRAIEVPKGRHRVRCYYESPSFKSGALFSALSLVLTLAAMVLHFALTKKARA
jgi:hypothetical protein